MAKVKNPLFSEAASGALGGLQYSGNGYGNIVSRRSITPHLMTPLQTEARSRLKFAQSAWVALTDIEKAAWQAFATPPETGRNTFVAHWIRWQIMNLPGNPEPVHHTSYSRLENLSWLPSGIYPPSIELSYDYYGDGSAYLIYKTLATYSNRQSPTPAKMLVSGVSGIDLPPYNFYPKVAAPVIHVRLEVIDNVNASIIETLQYRLEISWP
jgi:hypothetical protein